MAKVMITLRVMPESVEINLDELIKKIKEKVDADRIEKEPIAFGLTALRVTTFVDDEAGGTEEIENKIKSIEGVSQVETVEVSRTYI